MIETGLLHQVMALSAAQRLELIGVVWDLVDAEILPLDESLTVRLDEPLPASQRSPQAWRATEP